MKTTYPLTYILEYIPSRYVGLSEKQLHDRRAVWNFKDGACSDELKRQMFDKVNSVVSGEESSFVVCFLPASTQAKTAKRYGALANYLRSNLGCEVRMDAISNIYDTEAGHLNGKKGNPTENMSFNREAVSGKRVVLIDDVITRGLTFNNAADRLMSAGAVSVYGVFLAKTIHPDLPVGTPSREYSGESIWLFDDVLADEEMANELIQEEIADSEVMNDIIQCEIDDAIARDEIMQEIIADEVWEDAGWGYVY